MKNTFGSSVILTVFGESHGNGIGAVIDGIAPGITVDNDFITKQLSLRRSISSISTKRVETDNYQILSGVFNGKTTGTPICIAIPNENTKSHDYSELFGKARPGHADYTANCKYHGFEDYRGGGHFSGRITAGVVAAGAIAITALKNKGIHIATHIKECANVSDREFLNLVSDIDLLNSLDFAVLDNAKADEMIEKITNASEKGDSVGGILETVVIGLDAGVGEPWFDSIESLISHAIFAIPAVKGIEFGDGFELSRMLGSQANDSFRIDNGNIVTKTNSNGGINGGISNGMPIVFKTAIKPTPSIFVEQKTVDYINKEECNLQIKGRHDPCIVHRARVVVDSLVAITLCDLLAQHFGTDYLGGK